MTPVDEAREALLTAIANVGAAVADLEAAVRAECHALCLAAIDDAVKVARMPPHELPPPNLSLMGSVQRGSKDKP